VGTIATSALRNYETPAAVEAGRPVDPSEPSVLGNLMADAQLLATRAADRGAARIAFVAESGLRADLRRDRSSEGEADGEVTVAELSAVQPEARELLVMTLTGAQLRSVLEEQFPAPGSSDPVLALNVSEAFRYDYDQTAAPGLRVLDLTLDGRPVAADQDYRIVVNSYLASGGDGFRTFTQGTRRTAPGVDELSATVRHFVQDSPVVPSLEPRRGTPGENKLYLERMAGQDRYATAARTVLDGWAEADEVVLASGLVPVDALAGSYLSGVRDAPVLLTAPSALPDVTLRTLRRLGASRVTALGGPTAISNGVLDVLRSEGFSVERLARTDRYQTSAVVARAGGGAGEVGGLATAVLASGTRPVDALVAGSPAYAARLPVLLSTTEPLSPAAAAVLRDLEIDQVFVVGGEAALSSQVEDDARALGVQVRRLAGADRQGTARAVATYAETALGFLDTMVYLARGDGAIDALAGAPRAGRDSAPILLTPETEWFRAHCQTHLGGGLFGDRTVINEFQESAVYGASECGG